MNRCRKARVKASEKWIDGDKVYLEHTNRIMWTHKKDLCAGQHCTIHNMSNHSMRDYPQLWRGDRNIMERVCPHGVGHPDPDDFNVMTNPHEVIHGCDGCCRAD